MKWYEIYTEMFWLGLVGLLVGSFGVCCKFCYKCKINELTLCCGIINLKRDTNSEEVIDLENRSDSIPTPQEASSPSNIPPITQNIQSLFRNHNSTRV